MAGESVADGCQCGDGTIYRASNFVLTGIKKNDTIRIDPDTGKPIASLSVQAHDPNRARRMATWKKLAGFQLRYIYFLDPSARARLTVPEIPFADIDKYGQVRRGDVSGQEDNTRRAARWSAGVGVEPPYSAGKRTSYRWMTCALPFTHRPPVKWQTRKPYSSLPLRA